MKYLAAAFALIATPALAHHEVVVATSMVPLMGGIAVLAIGSAALFRKWLRRK